jgi:hypothetical protein
MIPPLMDRKRPVVRPTEGASRSFTLRLAGAERCRSAAAPVAPESPSADVDASADDGLTPELASFGDAAHLLRIDSFAAIAAQLDAETRVLFEEAVRCLRSLRAGRDQVEAKLRESGREDPIRTVTGTSALDAAVEQAEAMVRQIQQLGAAAPTVGHGRRR